jgi:hypothetical protein
MGQLSTSDGLGYRGRNRLDSGSAVERAICALGVRVYRKLRAAQTVFVKVNRTVPMNGKTNPKKAPALERLLNIIELLSERLAGFMQSRIARVETRKDVARLSIGLHQRD